MSGAESCVSSSWLTVCAPSSIWSFYDRHGKPRSVKSFSHMVKKLGESIGVKLSPHLFRHQHASQLLRAGVPIKTVQVRLGHASAQTTLNVYGHLIPDDDPALAVVESWLDWMI
ncbi:MAG: tyrosine-type recombinase/integrase [Candidatus Thiodiazotropha sp. (ex Ctena orbiculata)]|nr:tyrosine-type recombinase/integrase [Candidatus Thiodiazotropha taylori]MBT3037027.1 tyrosine-type recombinase/integrase [Candidatus Thiodiazotropha taylori]